LSEAAPLVKATFRVVMTSTKAALARDTPAIQNVWIYSAV
jgi:hypothetical protein